MPRERPAISSAESPSISHAQDAGRAPDDRGQLLDLVVLEPLPDAEAVAQRRRQQARARGGADERERRDLHADAARGRPLADHDVDLVVLHRRVEDLLDGGVEAVDLVDEEDVALLEVGEQAGDVALALERRPGRGVHAHAELLGDDAGERGLAEAGRAGEQHVVERVAALLGGLDEDLELLLGHALADEVGEPAWPEAELEVLIVGALAGVADAVLRLVGITHQPCA